MIASVLILLACSVLIVGLSIPLMRRSVRPNPWYGLRVPATLTDEWVWYEANEKGGRDLLGLGVILTAWSLSPLVTRVGTTEYTLGWVAIALVGVMAVTVIGWRRANRLLHERRTGA